MAESINRSNPDPQRAANLEGAPLPKAVSPSAAGAAPPEHHQVLETPEEVQLRAHSDKGLHEDEKAGAALAATGLGCLSLALLPWSVGIVILVAVLLMWLFHAR
jgi:hypothetical protein